MNAICDICGKPAGPIVADNPQVVHMACLLKQLGRHTKDRYYEQAAQKREEQLSDT